MVSDNVAQKAIETRYRDYRFRSRAEARWAVFFDSLGIKYEYEKEGYSLPSGRYLPDFWLPEAKMWFEVKGGDPCETEVDLMRELFVSTGYPGILSHGAPLSDVRLTLVSVLFLSDPQKSAGCSVSLNMTNYAQGMPCLRGAAVPAIIGCATSFNGSGASLSPNSLCLVVAANNTEAPEGLRVSGFLRIGSDANYSPDAQREIVRKLKSAHKDAMGARFEHGESGAFYAPNIQPAAAQAA